MSIPGFTADVAADKEENERSERGTTARHRISVPGVVSEEIGLGDAIKRITSAAGITSCRGCRRRAQALNSWLRFSPWR